MAKFIQIVVGGGQSVSVGSPYTEVIARVVDEFNNPFAFENVVWSLPLSGPSGTFFVNGSTLLNGTTNVNGYVSTGVIVANDAPGTWFGSIQTADLTASTGWTFTNLSTTVGSVAISTGGGQVAAQNSAFGPLAATVRDTGNNLMPGITVQFSVPAGHGTFVGGATTVNGVSNAFGVASAPTFTSDATVGPFTVTASVPSAPTVPVSTTTWATVDATLPTTVQAISGGGQQAPASTTFGQRLVARVLNALSAPLSGVTVTFTSPAAGASCSFPTLVLLSTATGVTDSNGYAQTSFPLANAIAGSYFVTATVPGATGAQFQLTNGVSYLPEVCTPLAPPASVSQTGPNPDSWVNIGSAVSGDATGAFVTIVYPSGSSKVLLCAPVPAASLAAVANDAIVNSFSVSYDVMSTRGPGAFTYPTAAVALYDGTTQRTGGYINGGPGVEGVYQTQTFPVTVFTGPATITGAQLKAGNFGFGFSTPRTPDDGGTLYIRNVKINVCYQNPNVPASTTLTVPLLLCEV